MGYEKDRQIQEWDQGWYFSDSTICFRCLSDPVLRAIVKDSADQSECSFCDRRRKNTAVDFDVVMRRIAETVREYFGTVNEEGLGWDYARNHRGIVLEFAVPNTKFHGTLQVNYQKEYPRGANTRGRRVNVASMVRPFLLPHKQRGRRHCSRRRLLSMTDFGSSPRRRASPWGGSVTPKS